MVEISDLTDDDANRYLVLKRKIPAELVKPRSEAVSTNCSLQPIASKAGEIYRVPIVAKMPNDFPWLTGVLEITRLLNIDVELNFRKCGLYHGRQLHEVSQAISSSTVQSTSGTIMFGSEMTKKARNY